MLEKTQKWERWTFKRNSLITSAASLRDPTADLAGNQSVAEYRPCQGLKSWEKGGREMGGKGSGAKKGGK